MDEYEETEEYEENDPELDEILTEMEEEHEDVIAEAEKKADKAAAKSKSKIEKRVDQLEKKIATQALESAINSYAEKADEYEKDLFSKVRGDIKSLEDFEAVTKVVKERAEKIREREAELMKQAEEKAARAWGLGSGPISGGATEKDEEEELRKRIQQGDIRALTQALSGEMPF